MAPELHQCAARKCALPVAPHDVDDSPVFTISGKRAARNSQKSSGAGGAVHSFRRQFRTLCYHIRFYSLVCITIEIVMSALRVLYTIGMCSAARK